MMPFGGLLGGALAEVTSAAVAVGVLGSLVCVMAVGFMFKAKELRAV
jgi:hypothetical protein